MYSWPSYGVWTVQVHLYASVFNSKYYCIIWSLVDWIRGFDVDSGYPGAA